MGDAAFAMAELFDKDRTVIGRHINNIYKVEELDRESTCAKFAQVQIEGELKKEGTVKEYLTLRSLLQNVPADCLP